MIIKKTLVLIACLLAVSVASAYEWTNLEPEKKLGGRQISPGYLRGKIVLLDCRDYGDKANFEVIRALQTIWQAYRSKPFILLGGHTGSQSPKRMAAILSRLGVTYPVYAGAALEGVVREGGADMIVLVDGTGRQVRVLAGSDPHRASGIVGQALASLRQPSSAKGWKTCLDYEIESLPGQAYLHLKDLAALPEAKAALAAAYPADAARYDEVFAQFKERNEVKKLAKLVELSRLVKDRDKSSPDAQKITKSVIEKNIAKFESLKESADPAVVQEAKNAIVDLKVVAALLDK